ncbi:hypothetical protein CSUB01_04785 [Colletotrichum sublineola]|uniref:Uncharacterized protein n=1 Tax=Colletotrichum sublineola TaxID=1173701 RepID=A0A066X4E7_COLSU|nr:hypothetical protein CSUB01_04785 [Colletotrichum sublineola]
MPFDFKAYDAKCNGLTPEELQREWEHYTRLISGASTSTAVSGMAIPFTLGVSTIGVAMAAPAIHNARKKREIIEKHLQKYGLTHHTRKRDVLGSMAVSGTIGVVTLGVGTMGADAVATAGAEHGISAIVENDTAIKVVTHAALDGVGLGIEHAHTNHLKKKDAFKAFQAAGVFEAVRDAKSAPQDSQYQPQLQQPYLPVYQNPPQYHEVAPGPSASHAPGPPLPTPSHLTTYNPAYHVEKQSYQPMIMNHQAHQHPTPQQPTQLPLQEAQHYSIHSPNYLPSSQIPNTNSQYPAQVLQPSIQSTSTSIPPTPLQSPSAYAYEKNTATPAPEYKYLPPPPQPAQTYQPMTLPPPPPYPPPISSPVQTYPPQQQNIPEPQYAPVPIPAAYSQTPNHTGSQQHPPTQAQQGYPPAPQLYQPQACQPRPLAQQQCNPLPTPISPPGSVNGVVQTGLSYFPAMATPPNHAAYNPQTWADRPYGQEPYTPAATPNAAPYTPRTAQAYPPHPQQHIHGHVTVAPYMTPQSTGYAASQKQ